MKFSILQMLIMTAFVAIWLSIGYISPSFFALVLGQKPLPHQVLDYLLGPIEIVCLLVVPLVVVGIGLAGIAGAWLLAELLSNKINGLFKTPQEVNVEDHSNSE
jgi:hypothetical protein